MKNLTFYFILITLLLNSCSYPAYLGKQYEKEKRFEESVEYYKEAYTKSIFKSRHEKNLKRVSVKLVESLKDRYQLALENREFNYAYFLINKALPLAPEDTYLLAEIKNWYRLLIIGRMDIEGNISRSYQRFDQVEVIADFYSPNQLSPLRSRVDTTSGVFSVEEAIYKPSFGFISFYHLSKIGLNYYNYEVSASQEQSKPSDQKSAFAASNSPVNVSSNLNYLNLIEFNNVKLDVAEGSLNLSSNDFENEILKDVLNSQTQADKNWLSTRNIDYQTYLESDQINVQTNAPNTAFLPQKIYINNKERFFVINFGNILIKHFSQQNSWAIKRRELNEDSQNIFSQLFKNIRFHIFSKYDNAALAYEVDN